MSHTIQIRNVPDDIHRTLRARAAAAGLSLSDFSSPTSLSGIDEVAGALRGSGVDFQIQVGINR